MAERAMRPFWIHQLAEYLIGVALVAQGMQDPDPLVPVLVGVALMVNTAIVRGPLGAFRIVGRGLHRWLDLVAGVVIAFAALQPWVEVAVSGRAMLLVVLLPLGFLWFYTDWDERPARKQRRLDRSGPRGEDIGRSAGRIAGSAYAAGKRAVKKRT